MKKEPKKRASGGGRKLKYGEPTKLVTFKCPESKKLEFRKAVNIILNKYIN